MSDRSRDLQKIIDALLGGGQEQGVAGIEERTCTEDMEGHISTVLECMQIPPGGNVCDMTHTALLVVARMLERAFGHSVDDAEVERLAQPWVEKTLAARKMLVAAREKALQQMEDMERDLAVHQTKGQLLN